MAKEAKKVNKNQEVARKRSTKFVKLQKKVNKFFKASKKGTQ